MIIISMMTEVTRRSIISMISMVLMIIMSIMVTESCMIIMSKGTMLITITIILHSQRYYRLKNFNPTACHKIGQRRRLVAQSTV